MRNVSAKPYWIRLLLVSFVGIAGLSKFLSCRDQRLKNVLSKTWRALVLSVAISFLSLTGAPANNLFFHLLPQIPTEPFVWTGLGGNANWSNSNNWSTLAVPGASDVAKFDNRCGANCAVTVDGSVSVVGVLMRATYTGTITQAAGSTMTIGLSGWDQSAGTFVGSSDAISISKSFVLNGGTFTSTSGVLTRLLLGAIFYPQSTLTRSR